MLRARLPVPFLLPLLASLTTTLGAQGDPNGGTPGGPAALSGTREGTWPAPTAEDWTKPCLVIFQRSWEDALALAKESGKLILVCVNMDGEIASENYAGIGYRTPEKAALYDPYVCVMASVYRHTPRDYDDQGRRIPCPRFGSVTCGEHIALEPVVYELFLDGRRIAPRHIAVDVAAGGEELYDIFYRYDTASVFADIRKTIAERPPVPPLVRGDRTDEERVQSPDVLDRAAVERAYLVGDRVARRTLLGAALSHRELDHVDLLRLALFGLDVELARLARAALAESDSEKAIDLIVEVLRVPMEPAEREALLAALERLGEQYPRARTLAAVQQGLAKPSSTVDARGWVAGLAGAEYPAPSDWSQVEARVEDRARQSAAAPEDPEVQLGLAEASLALAIDPGTRRILAADPRTASDYQRLHFEDARRAAEDAARLGASGWRVDAVRSLAAWYLGDVDEARTHAETAVAALPSGEPSWNAMGVLALFARARERAILGAAAEKKAWPPQWLADVDAAYSVLAKHPHGADYHVAAHHDFLKALGARPRAAQVLAAGLARFPESWMLHERLRAQSLEDRGVEGLEAVYEERMHAEPVPPASEWFAGYAALVTAEYFRRAGNPAAAGAAYGRAIERYEQSIARDEASRTSSDHYVAMALAGRARLALERGDLARAVEEILASFQRKPEAAATLDGLNLSPVDTAKMLLARLREGSEGALATRLQQALEGLDPVLLELPAYEREVRTDPAARGQRGQREGQREGQRGGQR
jgi:tetratricopeptide (TPR) repeat protein